MRGARWLLLLAIVVIVGAVDFTYRTQKNLLRQQTPPKPKVLPAELNFSAEHYHLRKTGKNGTMVEIEAADFQQGKDSSRVEMKDVVLKLFRQEGTEYDLIKSSAATFFSAENHLYSEGEVEITLAVPSEGQAPSNLVSIRSTGVDFDTHTLYMKKDVEVHWRPPGEHAQPMKIEAETLTYHESASEIWLKPWGRMSRANTVVEGYDSVLHLEDKAIRKIETTRAHGTDDYPNRKLQYAADGLWVDFNDDGEVQKILGDRNARLVSNSGTSETTITASRVEMDFESGEEQSTLSHVNATGNSTVVSKPITAPGVQPGETHTLHSDVLEMKMRPGGREIETVLTHAPARLEFFPNLPAQHHRTLDGKDMVIAYGPQNRIDSFRATEIKTETDPSEDERRRNIASSHTASHEILARFEPNSSQIASIEQSGDFNYEQGGRHAHAAKASLQSQQNIMLLDTGARVWDETGSTSADHIRMDQRSGDFTAEGSVISTRLPDKGQNDSGMLSGDEPLQAQARKMESTNRNRNVHYEGGVNLWQGANRIQANVVDVDREKQLLVADGSVVTSLWDEPKDEDKKKSSKPVLTVTRAAHLDYTDQNRLAVYTGGVILNRPDMRVKSRELRAFLADEDADSRLQKAFAEGTVEIVQTSTGRTRTGTSEHAEYYPDEQKIILREGRPQLVDSLHGTTHGRQLTYFANDDRLRVDGAADQPAKSQ